MPERVGVAAFPSVPIGIDLDQDLPRVKSGDVGERVEGWKGLDEECEDVDFALGVPREADGEQRSGKGEN